VGEIVGEVSGAVGVDREFAGLGLSLASNVREVRSLPEWEYRIPPGLPKVSGAFTSMTQRFMVFLRVSRARRANR
jgi:hypothetical protein